MSDDPHGRDDILSRVEKRMEKSEDRQDTFDARLNGALSTISDAVSEISGFVKQLVALETRHEVRFEETKETWGRAFTEIKDTNRRVDMGEERIRQIEIAQAATQGIVGVEREVSKDKFKVASEWVKVIVAALIGGAITLAITLVTAKEAKAATLAEITALQGLLTGAHVKIADTRTIYIWRAVVGDPAECWIVHADATLTTLKQIAYRLDQISYIQPGVPGFSEEQCYAIKL
jgi:hypothetical protein